MPSATVPAPKQDNPAGDMSPFIIFMAFVILTTVIIMSIYRINSEEDESFAGQSGSGAASAPDGIVSGMGAGSRNDMRSS